MENEELLDADLALAVNLRRELVVAHGVLKNFQGRSVRQRELLQIVVDGQIASATSGEQGDDNVHVEAHGEVRHVMAPGGEEVDLPVVLVHIVDDDGGRQRVEQKRADYNGRVWIHDLQVVFVQVFGDVQQVLVAAEDHLALVHRHDRDEDQHDELGEEQHPERGARDQVVPGPVAGCERNSGGNLVGLIDVY